MTRSILLSTAAVLLFGAVACGDDPFRINWEGNPVEATLFSLDRDELNRPSGFNMLERRTVIIESAAAEGRWDFLLDREEGNLLLVPAAAMGVDSRAGIVAVPGAAWDDVTEAPADSLVYITEEPVQAELGTIYIIRTHMQFDLFGRQCRFYGKVEPVELDGEAGILRFLHDTNPSCNDRRLVPRGS